MIRSFADKRTAAIFAGHAVRGLPGSIQQRAWMKLVAIDAAGGLDDLRSRLAIVWRFCVATAGDNAAFASTTNGACALSGATVRLGKSRSSTITKDGKTMTIEREDVDRQRIDFSDVVSGRLAPVHPGEVLRDEFLTPLALSVYQLAQALKISRPRLNDVVLGRRGVTVDTALRLGRYFGTTPVFWLNLQTRYDLDVAELTVRREIELQIDPHAA